MSAAFCTLYFYKIKVLFTIYDIERNGCAFLQSLVTIHVQSAVMYEYILAGFIRDEAITLLIVKPLHSSLKHRNTSIIKLPAFSRSG